MSAEVGILKRLGKTLEGLPLFNNNGFLGKYIFTAGQPADSFARSTIQYLKTSAGKKTPNGLWQRVLSFIPKRLQPVLGSSLAAFNQLPGVRKLSHFMKFSLVFDAAGGLFSGVKDTISGFRKTQGDLLDKCLGGISAGAKSLVKSVGTFAASVATAVALPAVFGISPLGVVGIATGFIGSMFASSWAKKTLDKVIKTPSDEPDTPTALTQMPPMIQPPMPVPMNDPQQQFLLAQQEQERRRAMAFAQADELLKQTFGPAGGRRRNPFQSYGAQ